MLQSEYIKQSFLLSWSFHRTVAILIIIILMILTLILLGQLQTGKESLWYRITYIQCFLFFCFLNFHPYYWFPASLNICSLGGWRTWPTKPKCQYLMTREWDSTSFKLLLNAGSSPRYHNLHLSYMLLCQRSPSLPFVLAYFYTVWT